MTKPSSAKTSLALAATHGIGVFRKRFESEPANQVMALDSAAAPEQTGDRCDAAPKLRRMTTSFFSATSLFDGPKGSAIINSQFFDTETTSLYSAKKWDRFAVDTSDDLSIFEGLTEKNIGIFAHIDPASIRISVPRRPSQATCFDAAYEGFKDHIQIPKP